MPWTACSRAAQILQREKKRDFPTFLPFVQFHSSSSLGCHRGHTVQCTHKSSARSTQKWEHRVRLGRFWFPSLQLVVPLVCFIIHFPFLFISGALTDGKLFPVVTYTRVHLLIKEIKRQICNTHRLLTLFTFEPYWFYVSHFFLIALIVNETAFEGLNELYLDDRLKWFFLCFFFSEKKIVVVLASDSIRFN